MFCFTTWIFFSACKYFFQCPVYTSAAGAVWASGLVATLGVALLAVFCFLSVLQLAMVSSKDRVLLKYSMAVIAKLVLALLASKGECMAVAHHAGSNPGKFFFSFYFWGGVQISASLKKNKKNSGVGFKSRQVFFFF